MTKFDDFLADQLKDPEFKKEWDALDAELLSDEEVLAASELFLKRNKHVYEELAK